MSPRERRGLAALIACMLIAVGAVALTRCGQGGFTDADTPGRSDSLRIISIPTEPPKAAPDTVRKKGRKPSAKPRSTPEPAYRAPLDEPVN